MSALTAFRLDKRISAIQLAKAAIAMISSWLISATTLNTDFPVFAAIAAILVVQPSLNQSWGRALERSIGVIIGVLIATIISLIFGHNTWIVLASVLLALLVSWALKVTPGTSNQVAISTILVLILGSANVQYSIDRIVETVIGAVCGLAVNALIIAPLEIKPASRALQELSNQISHGLLQLADALKNPKSNAERKQLLHKIRKLKGQQKLVDSALQSGDESLTFHPRRTRHQKTLGAFHLLYRRLDPMCTQLISMTRAYVDHYQDDLHLDPEVDLIVEQLQRASRDVQRTTILALGETLTPSAPANAANAVSTTADTLAAITDPAPTNATSSTLTSPIRVVSPPGSNWVLFGSLFEDLRRIYLELTEDESQ